MSSPVYHAKGLHTANNPLSAVPEGAMKVADNCVIRYKDTVEPRRGLTALSYGFGTVAAPSNGLGSAVLRANEVFYFQGVVGLPVFVHYNNSTVAADVGGSFADLVSGVAAVDSRLKTACALGNLYMASSTGVQMINTGLSSMGNAGTPRALDIKTITVSTGVNGSWMAANTKVSYKVVWFQRDTLQRVIWGAPSGRYLVANTAASSGIALLTVPCIPGATNTFWFRVYRTAQSASSTTDPGDNHYLVYEQQCAPLLQLTPGMCSISGSTLTVTYPSHGVVSSASLPQVYYVLTGAGAAGLLNTPSELLVTVVDANTLTFTLDHSPGFQVTQNLSLVPAYIKVADYQPDALLADPLYTNPADGLGPLKAAYQPPLAADIAYWNSRLWCARTTSKHRLQVQLLGINSATQTTSTNNPGGLNNGDKFTVIYSGGSIDYTFRNSPSTNTDVQLVTGNTSASVNVEQTAQNLVQTINHAQIDGAATPGICASYISGTTDAPGKILLEELGIGGSSFSVTVSNASAWAPACGAPNQVTSANDFKPNRLYYSEYLQPESVPLVNYFEVGSQLEYVKRIVPLRDKLYVFKNDGLFLVSGQVPPFRSDLLDSTVVIVGPDSAKASGNQVFALTNMGVVTVSELGAQIISQPIDDIIQPIVQSTATQPSSICGCAYDAEHEYILGLPLTPGDTNPGQWFVYNYVTNAWTRWVMTRTCAVVNERNVLYMGSSTSNTLYKERRTGLNTDYTDAILTFSIASHSPPSAVVGLNGSGGLVSPGDVFNVGSFWATVLSVNGNLLTLDTSSATQLTGTATIYVGYPVECVWQVQSQGAPGSLKHYRATTHHFIQGQFSLGNIETSTDLRPGLIQSGVSIPGWGQQAWGDPTGSQSTPWGQPAGPHNKRILVSRENQFGAYLNVGFQIRQALSYWRLGGFTVEAEAVSERTTRST